MLPPHYIYQNPRETRQHGGLGVWRIVCLDGKLSERYDTFDMTLTAFLAAWLSEEIFPRTFAPGFFPIRLPAFQPYTTQ